MKHMISSKKTFAVLTALALCPAALHAQTLPPVTAPAVPAPVPSGPAVSLKYKFAVGQVHRYQYDMDMNMLTLTGQTGGGIPTEMLMQMVMSQTIKSIRPTDGAATIVSQIDSLHMLMNGREMPLPAAAPFPDASVLPRPAAVADGPPGASPTPPPSFWTRLRWMMSVHTGKKPEATRQIPPMRDEDTVADPAKDVL